MKARDYSLRGEGTKHAIEAGLVAANWYHSDVPRSQMKELMRRSDSQAIKDTILLYGCMIALASMGCQSQCKLGPTSRSKIGPLGPVWTAPWHTCSPNG